MNILRVSMIFDTLILFCIQSQLEVLLILKKLLNFAYQSTNNYELNTQ